MASDGHCGRADQRAGCAMLRLVTAEEAEPQPRARVDRTAHRAEPLGSPRMCSRREPVAKNGRIANATHERAPPRRLLLAKIRAILRKRLKNSEDFLSILGSGDFRSSGENTHERTKVLRNSIARGCRRHSDGRAGSARRDPGHGDAPRDEPSDTSLSIPAFTAEQLEIGGITTAATSASWCRTSC